MRVALAFLVALTVPAFADMPPERFDHAYSGRLEKHLVPYGHAWAACDRLQRKLGRGGMSPRFKMIEGRHLYGCSMPAGEGRCAIVYSWSTFDPAMQSNVFRHERAHCNGWPADHPR